MQKLAMGLNGTADINSFLPQDLLLSCQSEHFTCLNFFVSADGYDLAFGLHQSYLDEKIKNSLSFKKDSVLDMIVFLFSYIIETLNSGYMSLRGTLFFLNCKSGCLKF